MDNRVSCAVKNHAAANHVDRSACAGGDRSCPSLDKAPAQLATDLAAACVATPRQPGRQPTRSSRPDRATPCHQRTPQSRQQCASSSDWSRGLRGPPNSRTPHSRNRWDRNALHTSVCLAIPPTQPVSVARPRRPALGHRPHRLDNRTTSHLGHTRNRSTASTKVGVSEIGTRPQHMSTCLMRTR